MKALAIELCQGDILVQVAEPNRQRLLHQLVLVGSYQSQDGTLEEVSVNRLVPEHVKLDKAALNASVHVLLDHGLEGAVDFGKGKVVQLI